MNSAILKRRIRAIVESNFRIFAVYCQGKGAQTQLFDYPASYHDGSDGLSFADGHVEMHKYRDRRTMPPFKWSAGDVLPHGISSPNNLDITWLQ